MLQIHFGGSAKTQSQSRLGEAAVANLNEHLAGSPLRHSREIADRLPFSIRFSTALDFASESLGISWDGITMFRAHAEGIENSDILESLCSAVVGGISERMQEFLSFLIERHREN